VALPAKVPESVEAAGGFDKPDHDLENRSTAGAGTGAMKAVHFGTLSDREAARQYVYHFLGIVGRGLKETLNGQPLLLAGVHEEIADYRRANKDANILDAAIEGSVDFMPLDEIARRSSDAAREQFVNSGRTVLAEFREMTDRGRAMGGDPHAVLRVAAAGRVHQLCVRAGTGVQEDLLNAAAAETIAHGGEVYVLPADEMRDMNPLAAILRF